MHDDADDDSRDDAFELIAEPDGTLTLRRPGRPDEKDIRVKRAFPWSDPKRFVSIRAAGGSELVLIEDLSALPPRQQRAIDAWLAANSFVPRITRIDDINLDLGYQMWRVQTDRGPAEFRVQEREDVRFHEDGRFSVKDADGNVYELPDAGQLDADSRRMLELVV